MDGLRGLAIVMVVCCHGFYYNPNGPRLFMYLSRLIGSGWMGVPIFFTLSGFLISYPFFRARLKDPRFWYPRGYATRRILKIFPPFYLTIVLFALYYYVVSRNASYFTVGMQWATGIAHFRNPALDFNGSFWSLWVELYFYLALPFLFFIFRGTSLRGTCCGLFLIFAVVPPVARAITWPGNIDQAGLDLILRRVPNALDNFAWGVLLGGIYVAAGSSLDRYRRLARLGYAGMLLLVVCAVVFAFVEFTPRAAVEWQRFLPGVAAFLMCFFIFDPAARGARLFSAPILRFTGIVSFEWFLLHQPVQGIFHRLMGTAHGQLPVYLFVVITPSLFTFVLAALIYYNFSLPIMRRGRNWLAARRKVPPIPQAPVAGGVETHLP